MKKKILVLQFRPEDLASDNEFEEAILKFGNLKNDEVHRIRLERGNMPEINLDDYCGVIACGGPHNVSDPIEKQSESQIKSEKKYSEIIKKVIEEDMLFLSICYIGVLNKICGGNVSKEKYSEDPSVVEIALTEEGKNDKITKGIPDEFRAIVAHKEACQNVGENTVILAKSETCPFELMRTKNNIYACQFHPDLDVAGLEFRLNIYKNYGYCSPDEVDEIVGGMKGENVSNALKILTNFIEFCREIE
ncbi:MAG: glutamine amidotransferase [Candidatus Moranbacteria bacterium]|nr:glutamine amidotransferase [Candidatus Moranbacteria bacterium]